MEEQSLKRRFFFFLVERCMLGLYYLTRMLTMLPPALFYRLVEAFGALLYHSRPKVRDDLRSRIADALGDVDDVRELDRIGRGAYCALLLNVPDMIYWEKRGDRFMRELHVEGVENLERADAQGKGVLLHMTHTGRSPLLHIMMARLGMPFTLVMFHPDTTPVPRYVMKMVLVASTLGVDPDNLVIWVGPGHDTIGEVRAALAEGKRVGVPFDVTGKRAVDLFGRPAALADGIAHWAIESGAPVLPAVALRTDDVYRSRLIIGEPLEFELTGDKRADVVTIMERVARAGEEMIREAPDQWMSWFGLGRWWAMGIDMLQRAAEGRKQQ